MNNTKYNWIIICLAIILLPIYYLLEWFGVITIDWFRTAEVIILCAGITLFIISFLSVFVYKRFVFEFVICILISVLLLANAFFAQDTSLAFEGNSFTYEGVVEYISYIFIMLGVYTCSKKGRGYIYIALISVALFEAFWGILQSVFHCPLAVYDIQIGTKDIVRAFGTLENANPYGVYMGLMAAIELGIIAGGNKRKIIHICFMALFMLCALLSGTRAAIVGIVCALIYLLIVNYKKIHLNKRTVLITILIFALAIAVTWYTGMLSDTIERLITDVQSVSNDITSAGSGRIGLWQQVWEVFRTHPLFGVGIANLKIVNAYSEYMSIVYVAHNEYLEILATCGIIGFAVFTAFLVILIFIKRENGKLRVADISKNPYTAAIICWLVSMLFSWKSIYLTPYFVVVLGLLSGYNREN